MYKAIKDNKIIAISDTDSEFLLLVKDSVETDETHTADDYDQYNGEYLLKSEIPAPSKEEQSKKREQAYKAEVDGITAHIQRLRDLEQTEEVVTEINQLITERAEKVTKIKVMYPYPTDPIYETQEQTKE